jgi:hypothetical protein
LTFFFDTGVGSPTTNQITNGPFQNGRPTYRIEIMGTICSMEYNGSDNRWELIDTNTGNLQYTWVTDVLCPISTLSDWTADFGAVITFNYWTIEEPTSCNCQCAIEFVMDYKGTNVEGTMVPFSTQNGKSTFRFEFSAGPNVNVFDVYWDGAKWVLEYMNSNIIVALFNDDTICPIGIFTIIPNDAVNAFRVTAVPCPIQTTCDCGITMDLYVDGLPQTWEFQVAGMKNGWAVFQYTYDGTIFSLWYDDGQRWVLTTGDILIGVENDTLARLDQLYWIGCPISSTDWENSSPFYEVYQTTGVECGPCICREDRTFQNFSSVRLPVPFTEQNRGIKDCCCEYMVLAGGSKTWENDMTSAWMKLSDPSDSVTFKLTKNGVVANYIPTPQPFPNESNAWFTTIPWKMVLADDGVGCYKLELEYNISGITGTLIWGDYKLKEYTIQNALKTARVRVKFNGKQMVDGIDFTGSNVESSIRFYGYIGNRQPNTEIDNLIYSDRQMKRVIRENLNQYEIITDPSMDCIITPLVDLFLLSENEMWISDYNAHNHSYKYLDVPVIVEESPKIEYKELSRLAVLSCIVSDKFKNARTFY